MSFQPGTQLKYKGCLPIGEDVTVVAWTPDLWRSQGCIGNYSFRRGLVPVFSARFQETRFWWASPLQLTPTPADGGDKLKSEP